ncbi:MULTISPECIES: hypothetical protein [Serratia]|uniref:hypothetical protein n=1 Tax=Serratia TaxID=613 RepID=UPI00156F9148|nr:MULTISPECIES: hypothetical protein [Serratia]MDI6930389.1 hypothetical protein [Serratia sp. Se-PFBMAAmG]MBH2761185.1 hypothetical protein [Serratia marcescens]MBH2795193.1 hypothetical protein [Serratia marcescens]MBH2919801.1 hypothetical protein [Serratia marcescens]MBH3025254.1 hypothetical protein [Serratia marcescens]
MIVFWPPEDENTPEYSNPYANLVRLLSRVALYATGPRINSPSDLSLVCLPENFLPQKKLFLSHINDSVITVLAKCLVWRGLRDKTSSIRHD